MGVGPAGPYFPPMWPYLALSKYRVRPPISQLDSWPMAARGCCSIPRLPATEPPPAGDTLEEQLNVEAE